MLQLPPDPPHFVDRVQEQESARLVATVNTAFTRPRIASISGPVGVGRTTLAVRLAYGLSEHYDRALHIDLDELRRDDGTVDILDAIGDVLSDLGVEAGFLEHGLRRRTRQYWRHTANQRICLVIDNARTGNEVRALLPSSGESLVIAVSGGPLYDLDDGDVLELPLTPLADTYALELLRGLVPDDHRLATSSTYLNELLKLCDGLPEALQLAARSLRRNPRLSLRELVTGLATDFERKGLPVTEALWDTHYRDLGGPAAYLYRGLSLCPGKSVDRTTLTALLGTGQHAADTAIEELESVGLLPRAAGGRFAPSLLLRHHARRCLEHDTTPVERQEIRARVLRWLLRTAQAADLLAAGTRLTMAEPVQPLPGVPDLPLEDKKAALHWLRTERHSLHDAVHLAYDHGLDDEAWALCEPLWTHFLDHRHYTDVLSAFRTGVAAAQRAGRPRALIRMRCQLARPLWEQGRLVEAREQLEEAATAASTALDSDDLDRKLAASVMEFHGSLLHTQGDHDAAAMEFRAARQIHRQISNDYGAMLQTYRLGETLAADGQLLAAEAELTQAHQSAKRLGRERMTARTAFQLGEVLRALGRHAEALPLHTLALCSARERGSQYDEARVHDALATLAAADARDSDHVHHQEQARLIRERNSALHGDG